MYYHFKENKNNFYYIIFNPLNNILCMYNVSLVFSEQVN